MASAFTTEKTICPAEKKGSLQRLAGSHWKNVEANTPPAVPQKNACSTELFTDGTLTRHPPVPAGPGGAAGNMVIRVGLPVNCSVAKDSGFKEIAAGFNMDGKVGSCAPGGGQVVINIDCEDCDPPSPVQDAIWHFGRSVQEFVSSVKHGFMQIGSFSVHREVAEEGNNDFEGMNKPDQRTVGVHASLSLDCAVAVTHGMDVEFPPKKDLNGIPGKKVMRLRTNPLHFLSETWVKRSRASLGNPQNSMQVVTVLNICPSTGGGGPMRTSPRRGEGGSG
jgi:hypothetical protein